MSGSTPLHWYLFNLIPIKYILIFIIAIYENKTALNFIFYKILSTLLFIRASYIGSANAVYFLTKWGCELNLKDFENGQTALHVAVQ
jgi:ankyrin repeat protein